MPTTRWLLTTTLIGSALLAGCMRRPVVYQNPRANEGMVAQDIDECRAQAGSATRGLGGETVRETLIGAIVGATGGAVAGAIWGNPGPGAASGAAGGATASLVNLVLRPHDPGPAYRATVARCLHDRGHEIAAWE